MKAPAEFVKKHAASILSVLSCFDRVIFKGHLPFAYEEAINGFVDRVLNIPRKEFCPLAEKLGDTVVEHAKSLARPKGVPSVLGDRSGCCTFTTTIPIVA